MLRPGCPPTSPLLRRRRLLAGGGALSGLTTLASCALPATGVPRPGWIGGGRETQGEGSRRAAQAPPGRLLYVGGSDVWLWEKGATRRLTGDRVSRQPVWSPDGNWIAHVKIDVSSSELWVMDRDSANSRQLTRNYRPVRTQSNWAFRPLWWPDGSRLLYLSDETTHDMMLWQISADGKARRPFLTLPDREGGLDMPSLTRDARRLAVVTYRGPGGRPQVMTYTLPNGPWRQVTDAADGAYDPAWSPDGARLAYTVRAGGRHDVWVADADGANPFPLSTSGTARAPCWSPDGRWLAFISAEGGDFDLWAVPIPSAALGITPTPATGRAPFPAPRALTRGATLDAPSGLSWTVS